MRKLKIAWVRTGLGTRPIRPSEAARRSEPETPGGKPLSPDVIAGDAAGIVITVLAEPDSELAAVNVTV